ncbi:MAG TPA: HD domain-containing protein, partial [Victivallales bacterium]|nr:HD domain-containing protein [Victivallales bacterium]
MKDKKYKNFFKDITKKVKKILTKSPACHDWDHTKRVLRNSQIICKSEKKADSQIVEIASLLHDIARTNDMNREKRKCHAQNGAIIAKKILSEYNFLDRNFINKVVLCVKRHRYRGKERPQSIEEKIVYDADKLDSLGAI